MTGNDDEFELSVGHDYTAGPERIFDGFLGMYEAPRPEWIEQSAMDLRIGGAWDVTFHPPGIEPFSEHRVITELDRPRHLAYTATIKGNGAPFDTRVGITVAPGGDTTRLTLTQTGFPTAADRDDFATAWPDVLEFLAGRIS